MGLGKFFNKKNMVSIFIIFIMLSSVIGYMFGKDATQKEKYRDYSFAKKDNQWVIEVNEQEVRFSFFPTQVEMINLSSDIVDSMKNTLEIDPTSDENDSFSEAIALAQYELALGLVPLNIYLRRGFTANNSYGLPVIGCEDATAAVPVIYFKQANETKIYLDNDCIITEIKTEIDAIRIADRLLYGVLGVIE